MYHKTLVVMNEQHELLPEQRELLKESPKERGGFEILSVPASGWTEDEITEKYRSIMNNIIGDGDLILHVIFASPVPLLLMLLSRREGVNFIERNLCGRLRVYIFHNDKREKKELRSGKTIYVMPQEGWKIV